MAALKADDNEQTLFIATSAPQTAAAIYAEEITPSVPVVAGRSYCASVYGGVENATSRIHIRWDDSSGNLISYSSSAVNTAGSVNGGALVNFNRFAVFADAPTGAITARIQLRVNTVPANAGTIARGRFVRPMFGEYTKPPVTVPVTAPVMPPWSPGDTPTKALTRVIDTALVQPGSAVANRITTVEAGLTGSLTGIQGQIAANGVLITDLTADVQANENKISVQTGRVDVIQSKVDNPTSNSSGLSAYIDNVQTSVKAYADGRIDANTQRINQLQASVGPQGNLLVNANFTALTDWIYGYRRQYQCNRARIYSLQAMQMAALDATTMTARFTRVAQRCYSADRYMLIYTRHPGRSR